MASRWAAVRCASMRPRSVRARAAAVAVRAAAVVAVPVAATVVAAAAVVATAAAAAVAASAAGNHQSSRLTAEGPGLPGLLFGAFRSPHAPQPRAHVDSRLVQAAAMRLCDAITLLRGECAALEA